MVVPAGVAVVAQPAHPLGDVVARGHDHAAVAARAEVLRGIERQARRVAPAAERTVAPRRAKRLRVVLDQRQAACPRERREPVDGGGMAVQVHRHDGFRARRERARGGLGIHGQRVGLDVHEHGRGAGHGDRGGRGDERKGRRQHLVAARDAERAEGQSQRVGAGADAERMPRPGELRQLRLQRAALGAEHELAAIEHALGGRHQLALEGRVLAREIQERNHRELPPSMAPRPTRVLMGPLTPSRFSVKRTSSSRRVRLTYSIASAQHCQCSSTARRFSTNVVW